MWSPTQWTRAAVLLACAAALAAPVVARPQFMGLFGGPSPIPDPPRVLPLPGETVTGGNVNVELALTPPAPPAPLESLEPPLSASTTLGQCPSNASRLLNEEVIRRPVWGARVATVLRYDGRGCFGERDCLVRCVKIDAPHADWRPTTAAITAGRLGATGIEVTLTSAVNRGYSVRVLIYGQCFT